MIVNALAVGDDVALYGECPAMLAAPPFGAFTLCDCAIERDGGRGFRQFAAGHHADVVRRLNRDRRWGEPNAFRRHDVDAVRQRRDVLRGTPDSTVDT